MGFFITESTGYDEQYRYYRATRHGVYGVKDTTMNGERMRLLLVDGTQESATYLEPDKRYEPLFRYITFFEKIVESHPDPKNVLLIGGAGFAFPKHFFASGQKGRLTVVEMDPRMIRLARRFFFLNELERDFDLRETGRLEIVEDDGFTFLEDTHELYDVILNDAYVGNLLDGKLMSEEGMAAFRSHLAEGGIYACNVITPLEGGESIRGRIAVSRMSGYFDNVSLYSCDPNHPREMRQNCMLVGYRPKGDAWK